MKINYCQTIVECNKPLDQVIFGVVEKLIIKKKNWLNWKVLGCRKELIELKKQKNKKWFVTIRFWKSLL